MGACHNSVLTMEEVKTSRARVAFVLLCGLAVCCGVMYATADGAEEFAHEFHVGSGQDVFAPRSIESVDVKKSGSLYTKTPDTLKKGNEGRERLLDFFNKIEDNIAKEVQSRKEDIAAIRAATHAQQVALATLDAETNAKIRKTNAHIAANAAQMKVNAKKARDDLDHAMNAFNTKMANVRSEASAGRSKLVAQAAAQDKKFREWANNKVVETTEQEAAKFAKVRETMAADRAKADAALAHMTSRLDASLNAAKVLADKHFATTVSDIKAAKAEAAARVNKFTKNFNLSILSLKNKAGRQVAKLNAERSQLSDTVESNRVAQAQIDHKVAAELKRMVEVGDKRYAEHVKKDKELAALMDKNRADNKKKIEDMTATFNSKLDDLKDQAAKDRAHAENALAGKTSELFETLKKNDEAQNAVNKELTDATHAMKLKAAAELRDAH